MCYLDGYEIRMVNGWKGFRRRPSEKPQVCIGDITELSRASEFNLSYTWLPDSLDAADECPFIRKAVQ